MANSSLSCLAQQLCHYARRLQQGVQQYVQDGFAYELGDCNTVDQLDCLLDELETLGHAVSMDFTAECAHIEKKR
ncbi:hypothetical protein ACTMU2_30270 [Cupriavidus basilensis]